MLAAYLFRTGAQFAARYYSHVGGWRLVAHMRTLTYDHLQKLSLRYFHDKQVGQLLSRTVNDNANLENLVSHAIPDALANLLLFAGVAAVLFSQNARLAFYASIPIPFLALLVFRFNTVIRPALRKTQIKLGDLNAVVQENLSGIKELLPKTSNTAPRQPVNKQFWRLPAMPGLMTSSGNSRMVTRPGSANGALNSPAVKSNAWRLPEPCCGRPRS